MNFLLCGAFIVECAQIDYPAAIAENLLVACGGKFETATIAQRQRIEFGGRQQLCVGAHFGNAERVAFDERFAADIFDGGVGAFFLVEIAAHQRRIVAHKTRIVNANVVVQFERHAAVVQARGEQKRRADEQK